MGTRNMATSLITLCTIGIGVFAALCTNVNAATIHFNTEFEVYSIDDPDDEIGTVLGLSMDVGDIFSAGYTIDTNPSYSYIGPAFPPIGTAKYSVDTVATHAIIDGNTLSATVNWSGNMLIGDNYDTTGQGDIADAWRVISAIPSLNPTMRMGIIFFSENATRLSSTDFFVNETHDGWDNAVFYFLNQNSSRILMLSSSNFSVSPIPEPSTLVLIGSGVVILARLRTKKKEVLV